MLPLQYSGLENSMDCIVHDVTKSLTRLSDFDFHILFPLGVFWLSYQLLADSTYKGFYLGSPFYSINIFIYFYASTKLF